MKISAVMKFALRIMGIALIACIAGGLGLVSGAIIGGNFARQFVYNGVQGYEAAGQVGLMLGVLAGAVLGWRLLFKRKKK